MLLSVDPAKVANFLYKESSNSLLGAPVSVTARTFRKRRYMGLVVHESVLRVGKPLVACPHVRAMYQHFYSGRDWLQTDYRYVLKKRYKLLQKTRKVKASFMDFQQKKFDTYDRIFKDIKVNGFKQSESIEENVEIALCADGQILLIDGRHRLAFAQILGLTQIPVVANLISEQCIDPLVDKSDFFKKQLASYRVEDRLSLFEVVAGWKNRELLVNPNRSLLEQSVGR